MFLCIIATICSVLFALSVAAACTLSVETCVALAVIFVVTFAYVRQDRWAFVRCHQWSWVRYIHKIMAVYHFAYKLDKAHSLLEPPMDALEPFPGGSAVLEDILVSGPDTYQKKTTNRVQIESLMECVCGLVSDVRRTGATPLVFDIGAGKALFTRAVYEALDRQVAAVALDSRRPKKMWHRTGDQFYDPISIGSSDKPYTRLVADVRYLADKSIGPLKEAKNGGAIAITKHLCGGASDASISECRFYLLLLLLLLLTFMTTTIYHFQMYSHSKMRVRTYERTTSTYHCCFVFFYSIPVYKTVALCKPPLDNFVGACCLAPCCHQKTRKNQYCNVPFLESMGFCQTHIGMRGGVQDIDFRNFGMLISMSRAADLHYFEYKKSTLLDLLGFSRAAQLGRKARRLFEEGRIRYLQEHGFEAHLVRYCDASITGDNLAIIARRRPTNVGPIATAPS